MSIKFKIKPLHLAIKMVFSSGNDLYMGDDISLGYLRDTNEDFLRRFNTESNFFM